MRDQLLFAIEVTLNGLGECTVYYYEVESTDPAGNVLARGEFAAGAHAVSWSPRNLPSGTYLARLESALVAQN